MQPATQLPQELQSGNCEQPELAPAPLLPPTPFPKSLTGVAQLAAPNANTAINMSFMMELSPSAPRISAPVSAARDAACSNLSRRLRAEPRVFRPFSAKSA